MADGVSVSITGLAPFFRAVNKLDGEFNKRIKAASMSVARDVVGGVSVHASGPQARVFNALVAASDRFPTIQLRKAAPFRRKRKGRSGAKAADVFFGAEFGANKYKQFHRPHAGTRGYVFWPTVRRMGPDIAREYLSAIEQVLGTLGGSDD